MNTHEWVKEKPKPDGEYYFMSCSFYKGKVSHITVWQFLYVDSVDESGGYFGLHCEDGDEWGDYEDLQADYYMILTLPENEINTKQ